MGGTSGEEAQRIAVALGRAVLESEQGHFVHAGIDNSEHVSRVLRLAEAVSQAFERDGATADASLTVREELEAYGRELFMAEWNSQIMEDEDAEAVNAEGQIEYARLCEAARSQAEDV